jgi:hypothetical protein
MAIIERQVHKAQGNLVKALVFCRMRPNDDGDYVDSEQNRALAVEMATDAAHELARARSEGARDGELP